MKRFLKHEGTESMEFHGGEKQFSLCLRAVIAFVVIFKKAKRHGRCKCYRKLYEASCMYFLNHGGHEVTRGITFRLRETPCPPCLHGNF
jgi:hypothetical protein